MYLYPNSLLSDNVLYGYNSDIMGFNSSSLDNGINIDTFTFGNPKPPFTKTLPTTTHSQNTLLYKGLIDLFLKIGSLKNQNLGLILH